MKLGKAPAALLATALAAQPGCATLKAALPFGAEAPTDEEVYLPDTGKMTPGEIELAIAMVGSNCKFAWGKPDDVSWDKDPPLWDKSIEDDTYMASELFNFGAHRDDVQCRCSGDSTRYTCATAIGEYEEIPGSAWRFVPITQQYSMSLYSNPGEAAVGFVQVMDPATAETRAGFLNLDRDSEQVMMGEMAEEFYAVWELVWANLDE
jgi:hypothetical protein